MNYYNATTKKTNYNGPYAKKPAFGQEGRPSFYNSGGNKENIQVRQPFGVGNHIPEEKAAKEMIRKMVKGNILTLCSQKPPEYYLRLIRYHFMSSEESTLSIQALGLSCQNLVYVACLVTMKGYAIYKRIKNDHLSVPVADSTTGSHLGLVKKVRLTVKLQRSENFEEIIRQET